MQAGSRAWAAAQLSAYYRRQAGAIVIVTIGCVLLTSFGSCSLASATPQAMSDAQVWDCVRKNPAHDPAYAYWLCSSPGQHGR